MFAIFFFIGLFVFIVSSEARAVILKFWLFCFVIIFMLNMCVGLMG